MHLKYINLVTLKLLFILGSCNFKFSCKIQDPSPPTNNTTLPPTPKLKCMTPLTPSQHFSKIFNSYKLEGGGGGHGPHTKFLDFMHPTQEYFRQIYDY